MIVLWIGVYFLVLKSISNFVNEHIQEDLRRSSSEVYGICDNALQSLMTAGFAGDEITTRIRKGKVLGEIELYIRQSNDLQAIVYSNDGKDILLNTGPSLEEGRIIAATQKNENTVLPLKLGKENYYARYFQFELWHWHIILVKNGKTYAGLISEVQLAYAATGATLLIACLLLAYYLRRVVQDPIKAVITSIQTNQTPQYKGIYEFEFLSDNIRQAKEQHKEKQLIISHQATHDSLTGLFNRQEFERCLEFALLNAETQDRTHTLLYLDLDQFKVVNDTCGHMVGDDLLRQVAGLLRDKLRQSDTLARLGGDEFGVLLENCPTEAAILVAESLRKIINDFRFVWRDKAFLMGVSIGLVSFSNEGLTLTKILSLADSACYVAKDGGRNRIHVYDAEDNQLAQRHGEMNWIGRIQKALDEDRFILYMQRIVPLRTEGEKGEHYELLLRMLDEQGQLVPPMAFIPAAERYNLMPALDRWVIKTAFTQLAKYPGSMDSLRLCAINLSGASIGDGNFLAFLHEQFEQFKIPSQTICFEITETSAIANLNKAVNFIDELKVIGCRFALDDFGSGMSSFNYLKHLTVDFLKIDGSFVKNMVNDPIDNAMVEAINRIGHVMGIRTIAEFVENEAILHTLQRIGVDFAQGYGIARPCPFLPFKMVSRTG